MQFSLLSKSGLLNKSPLFNNGGNNIILSAITLIVRFAVGGVFIFSGFTKAIDPWGTIYKITDYLSAMNIELWQNLVIFGAFLLCLMEFLIGVFIFTGCFRRGAVILALLTMCAMLPLTLWIAIVDPVADCGCFGDALILSNWATFWKNVILTILIVWLLKFNTRTVCFISPSIQWLAVIASLGFIGVVEASGYFIQPLLDFRQYKVGTTLASESSSDDEPEFIFTYRKGDITKDFQLDSLPDEEDGWEFVERKETKNDIQKSDNAADEAYFHIWDGENDVTTEVFSTNPDMVILLMPEISEVSMSQVWKINYLYDWSLSNDYDFIAAVSGSTQEIDNWKDLSVPQYPIYTSDDTTIKELARGNPAIVIVENGVIKWKSALQTIDIEKFQLNKPLDVEFDNSQALKNYLLIYLCIMALLMMATAAFRLKLHPSRLRTDTMKDSEKSETSEQ